ncbi:MAG: Hsp70 family protein [bacterium]
MSQVSVDFGTSNTVLARFNETTQRVETLDIPGIASEMRYRLTQDGPEQFVHVIPSLIHYSETETLIGNQVLSRGLAEHPDTFRWMKRAIARRITKCKKTAQGHIDPLQAGEDFLKALLNYASDRISFTNDDFTFTAPVEAFEDFQDWLWKVIEGLGIRRFRMLDEPTSCVFGYHGAARKDERFVMFDFGGGTLDVSTIRIEMSSTDTKKAVQLGQAGQDLGGMDIDQWLAEDFSTRHKLDDREKRDLEAIILRQAEAVKIALSDPLEAEAGFQIISQAGSAPRLLRTTFTRSCAQCERGQVGNHSAPGEACMGCILLQKDFVKQVRDTIDRALENAAVKVGMRKNEITKVLVTGGTSLVLCVQDILKNCFDCHIEYDHPFDTVVRGACRGIVEPVLQHDYAIESYNSSRKEYEFKPLFKIGTEFPTRKDAVRFWAKGSYDGMTRIGLKIYEVSRMKRRDLAVAIVGEDGRLRGDSRVTSEYEYICLNEDNPTFILADPPVNLARDQQRFLCSFGIDGNRRLLVTVLDTLRRKPLLKEHPVVRL